LRRGVQIFEPFSGVGTPDGALTFLGPSRDYYQSLICTFRETPEAKEGIAAMLAIARAAAQAAVRWVRETLTFETLDDSGETSAENNSSAVTLFRWDNQQVLFTADAGIPALTRAADAAFGTADLNALNVLQVPHHGSRRNVGPTILNRLHAPHAVISVCKDGAPKHPSKKVINALIRRGIGVYCTSGNTLNYSVGSARPFSAAVAESFSEYVEE
jgi:beta-lactamase superfamily II metal-dependent hydrolase